MGLVVIILIATISAVWYNPFTWFSSSSSQSLYSELNIPNFYTQSIGQKWVVYDATGEYNTYFSEGNDKKTFIGWYLKEGINPTLSDTSNKILYDCDGSAILDDKNKQITLKYETNKIPCSQEVDGMCDGYSIDLTDAKAVNIDSCVKINPTVVYQNQSMVVFEKGDLQVNNTLYKWNGEDYVISPGDVWIRTIENKYKFGENDTMATEDTSYKYVWKSNKEIQKDSKGYYFNKRLISSNDYSQIFEKEYLDVSDICNSFTLDDNSTFNPNCQYELSGENKTILSITFLGYYNSTKGMVFIDPSFTIGEEDVANAYYVDARQEANFSHLEIDTSQAPYDSLVGYWNFDRDNNVTAYDFTNNDNDGSYEGDAYQTDYGKYDGSLELPGDQDYVNCGNDASLDVNSTFTFSLWMNVRSWTNAANPGIISKRDTFAGMDWELTYDRGATEFEFWYGGGGAYRLFSGANVDITSNEWHLWTLTRNGSNFTMYIDGQPQASVSSGGTVPTGDSVRIGVLGGDALTNEFNGTIDEFMIFSSALTDTQIQDIYNNQSARYKTTGNQTILAQTLTSSGDNRVNMSVSFESLLDSSVEGRIGYWNTSFGYNTSDPANGLVSYWTADGDAVDEMGLNNGTFQGDANANEQGVFNNSFSFDGSGDYVNASSLSLGTSPFTINVWVNVKEFTTFSPTIMSQGDSGGGEWWMYFDSSDRIGFQGDNPEFVTQTTESYTSFVGKWIMITVTREEDGSSDNGYLYVNGELRVTDTDVSDANFDTAKAFEIGINDKVGLGSWYFNGSIDDVMIFNRTLDVTEINELYMKGRANWQYTDYQTLTSGVNSTFTIDSTTTNLLPDLKLNAGNSSDNPFYSPIVYGDVELTTETVSAPATPSISLDVIFPTANEINVTQNEFFNVTIQVNCLTGTCGTVNVSLDPPPQKVTYTPSTRTECDDKGICTKTLYSGIRYVNEDNKWKPVEDARSLKGSGVECIVNYDGEHIAECVDWNYTSKTIKVKIKDDKNKDIDIPIKNFKYELDAEGNPIKVEEKNKEKKIKFTSLSDEFTITMDSAYGDEVHFGEESTTITLQDADTENLDDDYIYDGATTTNYGSTQYLYIGGDDDNTDRFYALVKYDLTQIPSNTRIINASSCLYLYDSQFGVDDDVTIGSLHTYSNFSWNETWMTWNNRPTGSYVNSTPSDTVFVTSLFGGDADGWKCWDVTQMADNEEGNNLTIYYTVTAENLEAEEKLLFASKEYGTSSLRPTMNVTYDSAKSGLIPETSGTPFYTNNSNPRTSSSLSAGQSENITFWVNATGSTGIIHDFFAFANTTTNLTVSNTSTHWNVTIVSVSPPEDTSFTVAIVNGYTEINFSANSKTIGFLDAVGQDTGNAVMSITNTGNQDLDIYLKMNETATGFILLAGLTNDPSGAKIINTTNFVLKSALASSGSQDIWLWSNWTDKTPQTVQRELNTSVQIN